MGETITGLFYTGLNIPFLSHTSGETPDSFIADLAVAVNAGHLKKVLCVLRD